MKTGVWRRNAHQFFYLSLIVILVLSLLIFSTPIASSKTIAADMSWESLYESFISNNLRSIGDGGYAIGAMEELRQLLLADLTMDGVPELLLKPGQEKRPAQSLCYTVQDGRVVSIGFVNIADTLSLYRSKSTNRFVFVSKDKSGKGAQIVTEFNDTTGLTYSSDLKLITRLNNYKLGANPVKAFRQAARAYKSLIKQGKIPSQLATDEPRDESVIDIPEDQLELMGVGKVYKSRDFLDFATAASKLIEQEGIPENAGASAKQAAGDYATKRLIVQSDGRALDLSEYGAKTVIAGPGGLYVLQFSAIAQTDQAYHRIAALDGIKYVEADRFIGLDPIASNAAPKAAYNSWGVARIEADKYSDFLATTTNDRITVAIVDSGVGNHPLLENRIAPGGRNFVDSGNGIRYDDDGHGTHVAGTVVDCTQPLNVQILPVRVMGVNKNTGSATGSSMNIASGIRYAADQGARVINLSLGGDGNSLTIDQSIEYAISRGATVVVAAGNSNRDTMNSCPAHIANCIVVSAVNSNDIRANFSNYGDSVDVCAPGVDIASCVPGGRFASMSGTSMAAPHISAAAAMIMLHHPAYTPAQVERALKSVARDLGSAGWDRSYGSGLPQLSKLIY